MAEFFRFLVTGGAGFIGSHLVDRLIGERFEVTVLDDLSNGKEDNLVQHLDRKNFHLIKGDILDSKLVKNILQDVDVVFHEAAIVDVPFSIKNPRRVNEVNVNGTLNLLDACLNTGIKRYIYASSSAVYGNQEILPCNENGLPLPISPYAASKLAAERYCAAFHESYGLETITLRNFNVYGSRQAYGPYSGVITIFINRLMKDKPPIIYGDGEQTRDFVHVSDVVEAHMLALKNKDAIGKVINIAFGKATTINELAQMLMDILGKNSLKPIYSNSRPGDVRHSFADISLAKRILGYNPSIKLEIGLEELTRALEFEATKLRQKKNA